MKISFRSVLTGLVIIPLLTLGIAAFGNRSGGSGQKCNPVLNQAAIDAIQNEDYEAWVNAINSRPGKKRILQMVNESNWEEFTKAYGLILDGEAQKGDSLLVEMGLGAFCPGNQNPKNARSQWNCPRNPDSCAFAGVNGYPGNKKQLGRDWKGRKMSGKKGFGQLTTSDSITVIQNNPNCPRNNSKGPGARKGGGKGFGNGKGNGKGNCPRFNQ